MKVKILFLCLLLSLVLFISGCVTTPKTGTPFKARIPQYDAIVYFYRPAMSATSLSIPRVLDNDLYVFNLANGKYVEHVVNPGMHEFKTASPLHRDKPLTFKIKQGETHFLRLEPIKNRGELLGKWRFSRPDPKQALEEI